MEMRVLNMPKVSSTFTPFLSLSISRSILQSFPAFNLNALNGNQMKFETMSMGFFFLVGGTVRKVEGTVVVFVVGSLPHTMFMCLWVDFVVCVY